MFFRGFVHSFTCGDCPYAEVYWRLRAFRCGFCDRRFVAPRRCPSRLIAVWHDMWVFGHDYSVEQFAMLECVDHV